MIPKIIHQTWKGDESTIPEHWKQLYNNWKTLTSKDGWTYMFWTDEKNDKFIKEYYPWFLEQFRGYEHGIQRADAIRYFILHKYGGFYSDLDVGPSDKFETFYEMVKGENIVIPYTCKKNQAAGQKVTNWFLGSQPGSDFWELVWKYLTGEKKIPMWKRFAKRFSYYFEILLSTGPGIIQDAVNNYDGDMYIIPSEISHSDGVEHYKGILEHEEGSSWHKGSSGFLKSSGDFFSDHGTTIWIIFTILLLFLTIILWVKWRKLVNNSIKKKPMKSMKSIRHV